MNVSRSKPSAAARGRVTSSSERVTSLSFKEFVDERDYTGALTLLTADELYETDVDADKADDRDLWIAYCAFHLADYKRALQVYEKLSDGNSKNDLKVHMACCYFMLEQYKQAFETASAGRKSALRNRLMMHAAARVGYDDARLSCLKALGNSVDDQLSLAAIKYAEHDYVDAINVYRLVMDDDRKEHVLPRALDVYIAQCYYKLNHCDMSQELLSLYLYRHPDSIVAANLRACNLCQLDEKRDAALQLKEIEETASPNLEYARGYRRHNMVVFNEEHSAIGLQVLRPLIGVIPEALVNTVIYYLRQGNAKEAESLLLTVPQPPYLFVSLLLAITYTLLAQQTDLRDYEVKAIKYFDDVARSPTVSAKFLGIQCSMARDFLRKNYDTALKYLDIIKGYNLGLQNTDEFLYNYGQVKAAVGQYNDAIEALSEVRNPKYQAELSYCCCLANSYIMTDRPELAYEVYRRMEVSNESLMLLDFIANQCYKMGQFSVAMRSFAVLESTMPHSAEITQGKVAASVGVFQKVVAGELPKSTLVEVINELQKSNPAHHRVLHVILLWEKQNRLDERQQQQQQQLTAVDDYDDDDRNNNVTHHTG